MRFTNALVALGSVAGVISTFQDVNVRNSIDLVNDNVYNTSAVQVNARSLFSNLGGLFGKKTPPAAPPVTPKPAPVQAPPSNPKPVDPVEPSPNTNGKPAPACQLKKKPPRSLRFMPRALKSSPKAITGGSVVLYEDEWVTSRVVKVGNKISVVDVSGCSAVFIWDSKSIPSVFHIFCGATSHATDSAKAADELQNGDITPVAIHVAAQDLASFAIIKAALEKEFPAEDHTIEWSQDIYDNTPGPNGRRPDERYRFDTTAGTKVVRKSKQPATDVSRQQC